MPLYESVFIARQDIASAQVEALADQFVGLIEQNGGSVTKKEHWGLRNMAYRIKKNRKGHYVLFNLDAPASAVQEMERNMRINEDVIRYLTVRVDELEEEPSVIMRSRNTRDDRGHGRRGGGRDGGRDRDHRGPGGDRAPTADRGASGPRPPAGDATPSSDTAKDSAKAGSSEKGAEA